jgi:hypothetical protein
VAAFPRGSSRQTLRLDFATPSDAPAELRLDLSTRPGFVLLHHLALLGRKEETLWTIDGNPDALRDAQLVQCFVVNERTHNRGVLLCLLGDDPHVILPIPEAALSQSQGAGTIEVDFTPEPDTENSSERASGQKDNALLAFQFRIDELTEALNRVRGDLAAAQIRSAEAEQHLQHLGAELAQREQVIGNLQESVSWKITKPLRTLAHAGRKAKNQDGDTPR